VWDIGSFPLDVCSDITPATLISMAKAKYFLIISVSDWDKVRCMVSQFLNILSSPNYGKHPGRK